MMTLILILGFLTLVVLFLLVRSEIATQRAWNKYKHLSKEK